MGHRVNAKGSLQTAMLDFVRPLAAMTYDVLLPHGGMASSIREP